MTPHTPAAAEFHEPTGHVEIIARGVAISDGRVLMCRNRKRGYYYLPGGHVDFGEPAAAALAREIQEEMGLPSRIGAPLWIHEASFHDGKVQRHEINLVFHVEHVGHAGSPMPDPPPSAEPHIDFAWIPLNELDRHDIRPARAAAWLTRHARTLHTGALPSFSWDADFT